MENLSSNDIENKDDNNNQSQTDQEELSTIKNENDESIDDNSNDNNNNNDNNEEKQYSKTITEFSFGTFWNWFLPSSIDVWSSTTSSTSFDNPEIVIAYGSKSFLFLADVFCRNNNKNKNKSSNNNSKIINSNDNNNNNNNNLNREWKIRYRDIVNVFGIKPKQSYFDAFRSSTNYITTVVFDKTFSLIKHGGSNSNQRIQNTNCAMLFLGNSDGVAALYDCHRRITLLQNLPFASISRQCCKQITQKKILTAAWLHFQIDGPVVYYSLDTHLIIWKVKKNKVKIFHDQKQQCQESRFNSGSLQISCLASLPAECTLDRTEHKLAIGYMNGKIVLIGLDPITGHQLSLQIFSENGHNDDICSLTFSSYSLGTHQSYQNGLLCSVSRDSCLKVWSVSNQSELAEHRINFSSSSGGSGHHHHSSHSKHGTSQTNTNWFTATFLPRSTKSPNCAYEIVLTNNTGDLLTFTLPEKGTTSKLRIGKLQKTFQPKVRKNNELINHNSLIFSIAINLEQQMAITISLDYKLILWDLITRISGDVFYSFSNGALAIDCCSTDKRVAVAFGNNVFILNFSEQKNHPIKNNNNNDDHDNDINGDDIVYEPFGHYQVSINRLSISPKKAKFYNVIWNKKYFERLGRVIVGTSSGELYHYDLNAKTIAFKSNKSDCEDMSKIYSILWLDYLIPFFGDDDDEKKSIENNPVVLTLHQSGNLMINFLKNNLKQKNFENYLICSHDGLLDNQPIKRTAAALSSMNKINGQQYLILGNDDGCVDVFCRLINEKQLKKYPGKAFKHLYRFRAFNRLCLSIEYCSQTQWLAVTSLHENFINCYHLNDLNYNEHLEENDNEEEEKDEKLQIKNISNKCRLSAHEDRVSFTCWSPFNNSETIMDDVNEILLASASYDTTCIIWNITKRKALRRFFGHKSVVYTIKWCHFNSNFIFSGSEDNFFFWNWTIQPRYSSNEKIIDRNSVKINSLKSILNKNDNGDDNTDNKNEEDGKKDSQIAKDDSKKPIIKNDFDQTICSIVSDVNKLTNSNSSSTLTLNSSSSASSSSSSMKTKALLPVSNQIENNSSKYDMLDDIKWLIKLKLNEDLDSIPSNKLDRILLYGNLEHIERMLQIEIDYHKNNKNLEAQYILELFLNTKDFLEKSLEKNDLDPILIMISAGLSSKLYSKCIENFLEDSTNTTNPNPLFKINPKIKWNNYSKELSALIRLNCLNDFQSAIDLLLINNLYREAIILSTMNLASEDFLEELFLKWFEYRSTLNNHEGAIKCLIGAKKFQKAKELLEQRRKLCSDISSATILKQYDEVLDIFSKL